MAALIRKAYYYPLTGHSWKHQLTYKAFLKYNDCWLVNCMKRSLIKTYIRKTEHVEAYRRLYPNQRIPNEFNNLMVTNKQNFHIDFPNVQDRIPDNTTISDFRKLKILQTSGSTTGKPSSIPCSEKDIVNIKNYYIMLGRISPDMFPHEYKYVSNK